MSRRGVWATHGPGGRPAAFRRPREVIVAHGAEKVARALARADEGRAQGAWVAGWIGYEAGAAFEPRLAGIERGEGPLLVLGLFDGPEAEELPQPGEARLSRPEPMVARGDYDRAIGRVLDYVAAGDCYQVNLTFPLAARLEGDPFDLWLRLRGQAPPGHSAFVDLGEGPVVASLSPELFVRTEAGVVVEARPMKGTAPRGAGPAEDALLAQGLRASEKARAENLMIVDLLRNDIGRLAEAGTVKVPRLFEIESYPTVHQMTSTVRGRLVEPATMGRLMPALFPCGSVTGAPKIRAMEIIRELEPFPRGAYCGAVGWMGPDGAGDWSVAIRTLEVRGQEVRIGVGGGVVADSTAQGEWEEALWKARFLDRGVG